MDVYFAAGSLSPEQKSDLAERLTTSLLRAERAPDTPAFRTITWTYLHELDPEHVLSAARPASPPMFRIDVTTPEGALSDRRRAELVAAATEAVTEVVGEVDGQPPATWVLCREIAEGSWGAGGTVVAFQALREAAAAERGAAQAAT